MSGAQGATFTPSGALRVIYQSLFGRMAHFSPPSPLCVLFLRQIALPLPLL